MSGDMERMVREFKHQQAQDEVRRVAEESAERQADQARAQDEHARLIESVRSVLPGWLKAMAAAGNPGMELISFPKKVGEREVKKSIFGHKYMEPVIEMFEVVGWEIGWAEEGFIPGDRPSSEYAYRLYLLADGRFLGDNGGRRRDCETHELGVNSWLQKDVEKLIPEALARIAAENGVPWELPHEG